MKRKQTFITDRVYIKSTFSSVGPKEGEGPLGKYFDMIYRDDMIGENCWEIA